jgi:hypothetical protein
MIGNRRRLTHKTPDSSAMDVKYSYDLLGHPTRAFFRPVGQAAVGFAWE